MVGTIGCFRKPSLICSYREGREFGTTSVSVHFGTCFRHLIRIRGTFHLPFYPGDAFGYLFGLCFKPLVSSYDCP